MEYYTGFCKTITSLEKALHTMAAYTDREPEGSIPDKLAEGFVISERSVVLFTEDVVNVLHAPIIQKLR